MQMRIRLSRWEDGVHKEDSTARLDRWATHESDSVDLEFVSKDASITLRLQQQPHMLARDMGVGSVLWDGAFVLSAYLFEMRKSYQGLRCIELGSGVGLVGLLLACMGAQVVMTDRPAVIPVLQGNIRQNCAHCAGTPEAQSLQWGVPGCLEQAAALTRQQPFGLIVASDCIYIDQVGQAPSTQHFLELCAVLCSKHTRALITFEARSDELRQAFVDGASATGFQVCRLDHQDRLPVMLQVDYIELYELRLIR
ncbi:hypothetical protein WJX73_005066 [Symbiochloris irregularis]|uniref:Uncharacterized protein n=1 Tax=Symbiochloris irregularis TaxID=706552 RepID=A0AAW1NW07_9CHLO